MTSVFTAHISGLLYALNRTGAHLDDFGLYSAYPRAPELTCEIQIYGLQALLTKARTLRILEGQLSVEVVRALRKITIRYHHAD